MRVVQKWRIPIILLTSVLLTGCSTWNGFLKDIKVNAVDRTPLTLPKVDQLALDKIQWYIVNNNNIDKVLIDVEKDGNDPVIFGLSDKGYEDLSVNQAKTLKLIQQQRAVIEALKDYYEKKQAEEAEND